jgi:hypothetical protein
MNDTELKERYAKEPWGKLLIEMGMEPYDTESSARRVAEYAAQRIATLEAQKEELMSEWAKGADKWQETHDSIPAAFVGLAIVVDSLANA